MNPSKYSQSKTEELKKPQMTSNDLKGPQLTSKEPIANKRTKLKGDDPIRRCVFIEQVFSSPINGWLNRNYKKVKNTKRNIRNH